MTEHFEMNTKKLFVGDIGYALEEKLYHDVWGDKLGFADGLIKTEDGQVAAVVGSTAYGDGTYYSTDGLEYGVDAGVIGITDINYSDVDEKELISCGTIVNVPSGSAKIVFTCDEGEFNISIMDKSSGHVLYDQQIITGEDEDEEPIDYWYYEDDEDDYYDDYDD